MRLKCVIVCCVCVLLLMHERTKQEAKMLAGEKLQSVITPQCEHLFAKTCAEDAVAATEAELQALANRYREGVEREWGIRCTVRWEYLPADCYWFQDAVAVRVFVKQQGLRK